MSDFHRVPIFCKFWGFLWAKSILISYFCVYLNVHIYEYICMYFFLSISMKVWNIFTERITNIRNQMWANLPVSRAAIIAFLEESLVLPAISHHLSFPSPRLSEISFFWALRISCAYLSHSNDPLLIQYCPWLFGMPTLSLSSESPALFIVLTYNRGSMYVYGIDEWMSY